MKLSRLLLPLSLLALAGCASGEYSGSTSGYYGTVYDPAFYTNPWQDDIYVNVHPTRPIAPNRPTTLPAPLPGARPMRLR